MIETNLKPKQLLEKFIKIELKYGRNRTKIDKYEARIIDIDILLIKGHKINTQYLIVPHPRISIRKFVLTTLLDIIPNWVHEIENKTIENLYQNCKDISKVNYYGKLSIHSS